MATTPGDFTAQAQAYARARPGYPAALVDQLVDLTQVGSGAAVVEAGAGTGLFAI